MSRSGYDDLYDNWAMICWRGRVTSSIRGKRGQKLLRDMLEALDAMPDKRLISHELKTAEGEVCALGALGVARGVELDGLDPYEHETIAEVFDVAEPLVREIEYENDECGPREETPEGRWARVRAWVVRQIRHDRAIAACGAEESDRG